MDNFADGLVEITRRLEGYGENKFAINFAYYNPEKKEWILKIHEVKEEQEAANESN